MRIDLNCDLGESFGSYSMGHDEMIMPWITSANIACGFHAGDPLIMRRTIQWAMTHHVAIGAHPGLPDLVGFGRREMKITPDEAYAMVQYQVGALQAMLQAEGGQLHHVKPHGALYNMSARDPVIARAIAEAIVRIDSTLLLYGLAGSELVRAGKQVGLRVAEECFADRTYQQDGSLTPRSYAGAVITDMSKAVEQVLDMVQQGHVKTMQGTLLELKADTICIHGDGANALAFAEQLQVSLREAGVQVAAP